MTLGALTLDRRGAKLRRRDGSDLILLADTDFRHRFLYLLVNDFRGVLLQVRWPARWWPT